MTPKLPSSKPQTTSHHVVPGLQRQRPRETPLLSPQDKLTFLHSCVHSAKGFLLNRYSDSSIFPSSSPSEQQQTAELEYRLRNPKFICMSSTDFIYTFLTALKLIMLQIPGWDLEVVRRELRFDEFLERQCCEMEAIAERRQGQWARVRARVEQGGGGSYPADGFANLAKKMRCLIGQMVGFFSPLFLFLFCIIFPRPFSTPFLLSLLPPPPFGPRYGIPSDRYNTFSCPV